MDIGIIGLGRMGSNMAQRLLAGSHHVIGFDPDTATCRDVEGKGVKTAASLHELITDLKCPRTLWLMIPAGTAVDRTLDLLVSQLTPGDTIVDGGNSNYKDTQRRAVMLANKNINYIDCGTSGGVWGLEQGYSMMIGGDAAAVKRLKAIFETLAPGKNRGWGHVGPAGSGHFTKMVHNGIEYGMMQAYAEGFAILKHKDEFKLDLHQVAEIWRDGSVVRSWLLDLMALALKKNPSMEGIAPYVEDSGEGRWTIAEAIDLNVPAPVITHSLIERLRSRDKESFSDKLLSAMRNQFGGHAVKKE